MPKRKRIPKKVSKTKSKKKVQKKPETHLKNYIKEFEKASAHYLASSLKIAGFHPKHGKNIKKEVASLMRRLHRIRIALNEELRGRD